MKKDEFKKNKKTEDKKIFQKKHKSETEKLAKNVTEKTPEELKIEIENLKKENQLLTTKTLNSELEILRLKAEIEKNNQEFAEKAKTFASKAQEELNKLKQENNSKLENEKQELKKYANQKFFENFLTLYNNLELAVKAGKKQNDPAVQNYVLGFEMLLRQIENLLADFGLEKINPAIKSEFIPELHQAFEIKAAEGFNKNEIIEVKSYGYKLFERVIKPAIVIVAA
ncbi:nucleotide exchange factor GrpE [Candidatus Mycoplasma pogonae]